MGTIETTSTPFFSCWLSAATPLLVASLTEARLEVEVSAFSTSSFRKSCRVLCSWLWIKTNGFR